MIDLAEDRRYSCGTSGALLYYALTAMRAASGPASVDAGREGCITLGYQPTSDYDPNNPNSAAQYPPIPPTYEPQPGAYPPPPPPPASSYGQQPGYGQPMYPPPAPPPYAQPGYGQDYGQPGYPPPAPPSQPLYPPPPGYGPGYGQPPMQPMGYGAPGYPAQSDQGSGAAMAGLILGIIAVPAAIIAGCGIVFGVLGLVFSMRGRTSISRHTMAVVGIVLSSIGLGLGIINGIVGVMMNVNALPH